MKKSIRNSVLMLLLAFVLVGCGNGENKTVEQPIETDKTQIEELEEVVETEKEVTEETEKRSATEDAVNNLGIENVDYPVSIYQATEIFYATVGKEEVNIDSIEFDIDDGFYRYEINGWDGESEYSLDIDAETGAVTEQEVDSDRDTDDIIDIQSIISPTEAMAIAIENSGSGYVIKWELDSDDGKIVYEIDIEDGSDVTVDAYTGEVL